MGSRARKIQYSGRWSHTPDLKQKNTTSCQCTISTYQRYGVATSLYIAQIYHVADYPALKFIAVKEERTADQNPLSRAATLNRSKFKRTGQQNHQPTRQSSFISYTDVDYYVRATGISSLLARTNV